MTLPVPGLTTAELVRLFEATHEIATERDQERADHAETRKLAASLDADVRALKDRLAERDRRIADLEDARRQPAQPGRLVLLTDRPHHGPPGRCNCGVVHGPQQSIALNAGRDGFRP